MALPTQILLVEDDPVWRTMLERFLGDEPDLQVVQAVATKEQAISCCSQRAIDVVLMDLHLASDRLDGIQAILELSLMEHPAKVIALTSLDDEKIILDTYTAGAVHYISKSDFRKLPDIVREVLRTASPHEVLLKEFLRLKEAEQYGKLTAAEKEIVLLTKEGWGRTQLIERLGKSESTLKNQITGILRKFKTGSMKDVIRLIRSRGLDDKELDR